MRPWSIAGQSVAFALIVVTAAMALSFVIALALPPPAPGRMNVDEMATALKRERSWVIDTTVRATPPVGRRSRLLEDALARALARPPEDIRAVWRGAAESAGRGQSVLSIDGREAVVDVDAHGFALRYGEGARLRPSSFVPLFVAAAREADGRWLWGVPDDQARSAWQRRIAGTFLIAVLLVAPLAGWTARRIARPVAMLGQVAETAKADDESPFPIAGPRELRSTASAMNAMHTRIRAQASERVEMLAALAHDLRTPLTALRLRAEALSAPERGAIVAEVGRLTHMIAAMLDQAVIGAYRPEKVATDIAALVRACATGRIDAGQPVVVAQLDDGAVDTDPLLARRLIDNLLDNAVKHGERAVVSVIDRGPKFAVVIDDQGPGIPSEKVAVALKPFQRLEASDYREGVGLGLAICTQLAGILDVELTFKGTSAGMRVTLGFAKRNG